jgi:hypothetical protein
MSLWRSVPNHFGKQLATDADINIIKLIDGFGYNRKNFWLEMKLGNARHAHLLSSKFVTLDLKTVFQC